MTLPQKQLYDKSNTPIQPIVERFIDTAHGVSLTWGSDIPLTSDGFVKIGAMTNLTTPSWVLYVDGELVANHQIGGSEDTYTGHTTIVPVKSGQTIKAIGGISGVLIFYPCK